MKSIWQLISSVFRREKPTTPASKVATDALGLAHEVGSIPEDIAQFVLKRWDAGIFAQELVNTKLAPKAPTRKNTEWTVNDGQIQEGTYGGTQLALTEMYDRVERAFISWFDALGIEPTIPLVLSLEDKTKRYQWSTDEDYPPHLKTIPYRDQAQLYEIFNVMGLIGIAAILPKIVPKTKFLGSFSRFLYQKVNETVHGTEYEGLTIADVERANRENKKTGTDIMKGDNIGLLQDWWSDARFAQQSFSGTNPNTITLASPAWVKAYSEAATAQGRLDARDFITRAEPSSLYIQDASYFREAVKAASDDNLVSKDPDMDDRYQYASVTLYKLDKGGRLHPLAIVIDWKGSMEKSVVIFNKRLQPFDSSYAQPSDTEKNDWPWRFAKTCAQSADWIRHEIAVHLVDTHFVEEVVIVAANRTLPPDHPVYRLLEPHWFRTLSLNAAARKTLVPSVVVEIIGFTPSQAKAFINYAFDTFDFAGRYVPVDLASRGFPPTELESNPMFKNYAYARHMIQIWRAIRAFVASMIDLSYADDSAVASDTYLSAWTTEIRAPDHGRLPSFPILKKKADLVDALTMAIHIASPQHTAVNYLQNFYQAFVIAKPPALYIPPPTTLDGLKALTEIEMVKALPISRQREWLLASQVPWLLSFRVADEYNLVTYAASLWNLYKKKTGTDEVKVKAIAEAFYGELRRLVGVFKEINEASGTVDVGQDWGASGQVRKAEKSTEKAKLMGMEEGSIPYTVLDPNTTAVSILI